MPYSYDEYTASGGNATYAYTFDTIDPSHVKVNVAGVAATFTHDTAQSQITVTSSLTDGQLVRVYRDSSQGTRLVDYADGVAVGERSLDMDSRQAFYMSQEALDKAAEAPDADPLFSQDTAGNVPGPTAADISNNFVLQADGDWVANAGGGGGGSGEINTASNVGAGTGAFAQKSGVDFQFKSLTGTSGLLSNTATEINIDAARASHSHSLSAITDLGNFSTSAAGLVPAPTAGDVTADRILQADGTWVDQTGGAGATSTQSLTDVQNTGATEGQALIYRTNEYVPETVLSTNLSVTPPAAGSVLISDGTNIVDLTGGTTGQVIKKIAGAPGAEWADESAGSGTVQGIAGTGGGAALNDGLSGTDVQVKSLTGGGGVTFNTATAGEVRIDVNHDSIDGFVAGEHRVINDSGTSLTELWSASKTSTELALKFDAADFNGDFDTRFSSKTLGGLNGVQSASVDSASDADTMVYSSANSRWEAQPGVAADLTGVANFDLFAYNATRAQWEACELSLFDSGGLEWVGTTPVKGAWADPAGATSRMTLGIKDDGIDGDMIGAVDVHDLADVDSAALPAKGSFLIGKGSEWGAIGAGTTGQVLMADTAGTGDPFGAKWITLSTGHIGSGTFADARISESSVTQHQSALSIAATQITGTLADARVAETNVTQHEAALSVATSQLTGTLADARVAESNVTQHAQAVQEDSAISGPAASKPGSPATGQRYFNTDDFIEYYYTGSKWLSTHSWTETWGKASAASSNFLRKGDSNAGGSTNGLWLPMNCTITTVTMNSNTATDSDNTTVDQDGINVWVEGVAQGEVYFSNSSKGGFDLNYDANVDAARGLKVGMLANTRTHANMYATLELRRRMV